MHRLLGLVGYAANPRNIDLSDLPDLTGAIAEFQTGALQAARIRR